MFFSSVIIGPFVVIVAFILIRASVRILREYERAVVFTLGRFQKVLHRAVVWVIISQFRSAVFCCC